MTSGGIIGNDSTVYQSPFVPNMLQNVTLPTGGTGALEYLWISTTDAATAQGIAANFVIDNTATAATYTPAAITQTTWYRRLARRAPCGTYEGESNWVCLQIAATQPLTITLLPNMGGTNTICEGSMATMTAHGGTAYQWSTGSTAAAMHTMPTQTTTYTVTITNTVGSTATQTITVNVVARPDLNLIAPATAAEGEVVILRALSRQAITFLWSTAATTALATVVPLANTQTYTVTVTGAAGCTTSRSHTLTTLTAPTGSVADSRLTAPLPTPFLAYPNPNNTGNLTLHLTAIANGAATLRLTNLATSQTVLQQATNLIIGDNMLTISLLDVPVGNYALQILAADLYFAPQKIVRF